MTLADAKARIKAHHVASRHLCKLVLEGSRVLIRHKQDTHMVYKWDNSTLFFEVNAKYVKEIREYLNQL